MNAATPHHTVRTARKTHRCDHARWRDRVELFPICGGHIEPGEKYVECYALGEPYHPARYHLGCWDSEMAGGTS